MGYAVIMFVIMLLMAVSIALSANYGMSKDSQEAPLLAENAYADREGGKLQTKLTIFDTCINGQGDYTAWNGNGPYTLWLTVINEGSNVLNPNNATVLFNTSYFKSYVSTKVGSFANYGNVWPPLGNLSIYVPNIYMYNINYPNGLIPYRLKIAAENGITTIAPTTPDKFGGTAIKANSTYEFWWNASYDSDGVAYYLIYGFDNKPDTTCPPPISYLIKVPGNYTVTTMDYQVMCDPSCNTDYFYMTAVDNYGNMGVQTYTLKCIPAQNKDCV